jgi:hypothetical protein
LAQRLLFRPQPRTQEIEMTTLTQTKNSSSFGLEDIFTAVTGTGAALLLMTFLANLVIAAL